MELQEQPGAQASSPAPVDTTGRGRTPADPPGTDPRPTDQHLPATAAASTPPPGVAVPPGAADDRDRGLAAGTRHTPSPLPAPRGPVSDRLLSALRREPGTPLDVPDPTDDPLTGEDTHLALDTLYELHYRGIDGVDERWEWDPELLRVRARLEARFEVGLRDAVGELPEVDDATAFLQALTADGDGPSLSAYLEHDATLAQFQEQAIHRSAWQLKEADPHSWAIPRLAGRPKAALVEIQADEYGEGVERDIHAELYALTMERLGLSASYNAYLDVLPGVTLATVNLVSMFGLHRRWLGALVGHLAVFEMTSTTTMARYATALRRMDFDPWTCLFYDTHVVADAHHQTVAAVELVGGLLAQEPERLPDVVFGALAIGTLEGILTDHILDRWQRGETSLLAPVDLPEVAPGQVLDPPPADDPRIDETRR
jgi:hypothetical protein